MATTTFTIGEAAARSGVSVDTIRFYERVGVLPKPPRTTRPGTPARLLESLGDVS